MWELCYFFRRGKLQSTEKKVRQYIQDNYQSCSNSLKRDKKQHAGTKYSERGDTGHSDRYSQKKVDQILHKFSGEDVAEISKSLDNNLDRTFRDALLDIIERKELRSIDVYRRARIDRRLYSKIISNQNFHPSRDTALALIFALRLELTEAEDLLSRAGYVLSHSNKRDVIIEYFIREEIYNLIDINIMLHDLGQKPIGR